MTRRSRQAVPDWPKSLALPAVQEVIKTLQAVDGPPKPGEVLVPLPSTPEEHAAQGFTYRAPAPLTTLFFGLTKDGRHLAAEAQVTGDTVTALTPLCCSIHAQESAKAWEACAFARLCHGREYSTTERYANTVQGKGARVEDVAEGYAVALVKRSGKTVALAMEVEGATVKEPKVLGSGDRLYAWQEAHAYAQRWFLPKRRKGT